MTKREQQIGKPGSNPEPISGASPVDEGAVTTLCWRCDKGYAKTAPACPLCGAINANVDADGAFAQMAGGR